MGTKGYGPVVAEPPKYRRSDFDRWVTLKAPDRGTPGYTEAKPAYSAVATVPAKVEVLSGRDLQIAQQSNSMATHRVAFDFFPGLHSDWVIEWEGRELQIDGIPAELGRQDFHEVMCLGRG